MHRANNFIINNIRTEVFVYVVPFILLLLILSEEQRSSVASMCACRFSCHRYEHVTYPCFAIDMC